MIICKAAIMAFLAVGSAASTPSYLEYTTVTGFFQQDDAATAASTFSYTETNFGLIDRAYDTDAEYDPDLKKTQWQRFEHKLFRLNRESGRDCRYKLLYLGRHGEGFHNVAESFYGTPAWDCYWSKVDGNGTAVWDDAHITDNGRQQAVMANGFWQKEIREQRIPVPERYYTSPLSRCLATAKVTFEGLDLPSRRPFIPEVKELLREAIGIHTCDRRKAKSVIHAAYPTYTFEPGFAAEDPLWSPDLRESETAQTARLKQLLGDVFAHDDSTYISMTAHSGAISALLRAIHHRTFGLVTGAVIPVLVKAERIQGTPEPTRIEPPTTAPTCTANPTPSP